MSNHINYLLEVNFCLLVLFTVYYLFLRKETDFKFRRGYLLLTLLISFLAPLLKLGNLSPIDTQSISTLPAFLLPELFVGNAPVNLATETTVTESGTSYFTIGYWVIAAILLQFFLFKLFQIAWFILSNKTSITKKGNVFFIETNGTLPTFSFFNVLFFDNSIDLTEEEHQKIIDHELAHIQQGHSIDIILFELAKAAIWFNPITWLLRNEIQDIHEYLADDKVIDELTKEEYGSLLAKMTLNQAHLSIGHHFSKSKTIKRLKMMKTIKQNVKTWKTALIIPLLALTVIAVSCNDEIIQDIDNVMETASQTEIPEAMQAKFNELQLENPDADLTYFEVDASSEESMARLKDIDPESIALIEVYKEHGKIGVIMNKNGALQKMANTPDANGVFTIVDQVAEPKQGYQAFYDALAKEMKYPAQARKEGVTGRVYVQFIINKIGALEDIKVVKGIGAGCDAEAVRAIAAAGDWNPPIHEGEVVKQRIILPITFALPGIETATGSIEKQNGEFVEVDYLAENNIKLMEVELTYNGGAAIGQVLTSDGKPLAGVNVVVEGKTIGTITNLEGKFELAVNKGVNLKFSFIGYESQTHSL